MTALAPSTRPAVLVDRVFPRSLALDAVLVIAGAALVTVFAQIAVPTSPVPVTGQTLAVLLVGAALGAVRGGISLALYAVLGLLGLPVLSERSSGLGVMLGPTGGYIIGFIVAAVFVGWLSERAWERKILRAIVTFLAGSVVVFAIGLPWLAVALGGYGLPNDLDSVLVAGFYPFILGDLIKAAIAAGLLPLAWWGADRIAAQRAADDGAAS
jgi:biotin transport system substrate-specific component